MAQNEMKAKPALPERVRSMEGLGVAVCWRFIGSGWRCVAGDTKLVSIGISEVGAIVVLVIFGPQPRRTFGGSTTCQSDSVSLFNDCSAFGQERDHLTIAGLLRQFVVRGADEEEWAGARTGLPASPRPLPVTETSLDAECGH